MCDNVVDNIVVLLVILVYSFCISYCICKYIETDRIVGFTLYRGLRWGEREKYTYYTYMMIFFLLCVLLKHVEQNVCVLCIYTGALPTCIYLIICCVYDTYIDYIYGLHI